MNGSTGHSTNSETSVTVKVSDAPRQPDREVQRVPPRHRVLQRRPQPRQEAHACCGAAGAARPRAPRAAARARARSALPSSRQPDSPAASSGSPITVTDSPAPTRQHRHHVDEADDRHRQVQQQMRDLPPRHARRRRTAAGGSGSGVGAAERAGAGMVSMRPACRAGPGAAPWGARSRRGGVIPEAACPLPLRVRPRGPAPLHRASMDACLPSCGQGLDSLRINRLKIHPGSLDTTGQRVKRGADGRGLLPRLLGRRPGRGRRRALRDGRLRGRPAAAARGADPREDAHVRVRGRPGRRGLGAHPDPLLRVRLPLRDLRGRRDLPLPLGDGLRRPGIRRAPRWSRCSSSSASSPSGCCTRGRRASSNGRDARVAPAAAAGRRRRRCRSRAGSARWPGSRPSR